MDTAMDDLLAQKAAGDEAFRAGQLEQALEHYTAALEADPQHVPTLCNRSLAALKLGMAEDSLQDAEAALQVLSRPGRDPPAPPVQVAKAAHRKAEALAALGRLLECIRAYRQGLEACPCSPELHAALRLVAEELPVRWLAKYWARHVEHAQAPHPLSSRDGRLIKPVPAEQRLPPPDLQAHLEAALYPLQDEARDLLCAAWAEGGRPGKAEASFMRGAAYLNAGNAQQALKDARFALAYGPQLESATSACTDLVQSSTAGGKGKGKDKEPPLPPPEPPTQALVGKHSAWPAALALLSGALESLADNVLAVVAMQRALELDPENGEYEVAVERLLRRIPEPCAAAIQATGAAGLEAHLAALKEAATPEFRRQRPKYYYYYEWMKKRITAQYPELPEPVMDKLLALEANELDMILQYPRATQITVERLMHVYERQGAEQLETYAVPLLSWEDYRAIKENPAAPALPAGDSSAAAGRLLEAGCSTRGQSRQGGQGEGEPAAMAEEAQMAAECGAGGASDTTPKPPAEATGHGTGTFAGAGGGGGPAAAPAAVPTPHAAAAAAADVGETAEVASEAGSIEIDDLFELD